MSEIKIYPHEVEVAAKELGIIINNLQVQEFISRNHGQLEAAYRNPIREWIKARLKDEYPQRAVGQQSEL